MAINDQAPFLAEEIIINILKYLPVKSLKRFQCVCKHWYDLIKTPSFIHCHSTHQTSTLLIKPHFSEDTSFHLLCFNSYMQFHEFDLPPLMGSKEDLQIVASCNGLICLVRWGDNYVDPIIWNPATREIKELSVNGNGFSDFRFDWYFGFGFSHIINDFKMVKMFQIDRVICGVEVYSLRDGCWRNIEFDNIKDISVRSVGRVGVTGNGVIFWRGTKNTNDKYSSVIISFDLVTEVFTVIPWPAFASDYGMLAVYDGKLALMFYDKVINSKSFSVYFGVMEGGAIDSSEERWSSSEKYFDNGNYFYSKLFPKAAIWRNQFVSIDLGIENPKQLYLMDVKAKECKWLVTPELYGMSIFNYVESLEPVSGDIKTKES